MSVLIAKPRSQVRCKSTLISISQNHLTVPITPYSLEFDEYSIQALRSHNSAACIPDLNILNPPNANLCTPQYRKNQSRIRHKLNWRPRRPCRLPLRPLQCNRAFNPFHCIHRTQVLRRERSIFDRDSREVRTVPMILGVVHDIRAASPPPQHGVHLLVPLLRHRALLLSMVRMQLRECTCKVLGVYNLVWGILVVHFPAVRRRRGWRDEEHLVGFREG